jgi:hypothetical protein
MVMDRIGIKKIIREEFLYLEGKNNDWVYVWRQNCR